MPFSSLLFIHLFLPCFLLVYWLTPRAGKNWVAIGASLLFYAWGAPRFLQPLARWFIIDRTLKAGRFTRKGRAPAIFQPAAKTPAARPELLARLTAAVSGMEADIRSGHPSGRHTVAHPFFGPLPTIDWMKVQAIHARHHRSQLT